MKKAHLLALLVFLVAFSGCQYIFPSNQTTEPEATTTEKTTTEIAKETTATVTVTEEVAKEEDDYKYKGEYFSLTLPAAFEEADGIIKPSNDSDFPIIVIGMAKDEQQYKMETLLNKEIEWNQNLCTETEACGEFIENENIELDGMKGVKYTKQITGRSIGETEGFLNEYFYVFSTEEGILRVHTSATDLESPEEVEKAFDDIMGTITF